MSNFGQAALMVAGFAVGSAVGFPQLGFIAGSLLGNALFPTRLPGASGPRLQDQRTTTATVGAAVAEAIGTDALAGNVIWVELPVREVATTEEVGGKGGPSQEQTTYTYFQSIAVGICEGPKGGLLRIWENGALVYDVRPQREDESDAAYAKRAEAALLYAEGFTFYPGDEEQLPDPTIELHKGVGNVPAFRGLCYIVFHDRQLQNEQGLRQPNFKFEVTDDYVGQCNLEFSGEVVVLDEEQEPPLEVIVAPDPEDGWELAPPHLYRVLQTGQTGGDGTIDRRPLNPCVPIGDPRFDDQAFWEAAYDAAVTDGYIIPGYDYENGYPVEVTSAYVRGGTPEFQFETSKVYFWLESNIDPRDPRNTYRYEPQYLKAGAAPYDAIGGYSSLGLALDNLGIYDAGPAFPVATGILGHNPNYAAGYEIQPWQPERNYPVPTPPAYERIGGPQNIPTMAYYRESLFFARVPASPLTEGISAFSTYEQQMAWVASNIGKFGAAFYTDLDTYTFLQGVALTAGYHADADQRYTLTVDTPEAVFASGYYLKGVSVIPVESDPVIPDDDPYPDVPWQRIDRNWRWMMRLQQANAFNAVSSLPEPPARPSGHPDYDDQAFWDAVYAEKVATGHMVSGLSYSSGYPQGMGWGFARVVCSNIRGVGDPIPLSEIVSRICLKAGLSEEEFDASELTDEVKGYTRTRVMTARDALEPLRNVGFFDVIESGEKIIFRKRGGPIDRTLTEDDLGAYEGQADAPPPALKIREVDESTLPRRIFVHFREPERDYEDGEQASPSRSTADTVNDLHLEVPVAMDATTAKRCAEVLWADAWEARFAYETQLDVDHADLEPGDVLEVPVEGFTERVRVSEGDQSIGVLSSLLLTRDYDGNYVSVAVADPPSRTPGEMLILGPSEILWLDIPPLRAEDNDVGVYATTRPIDAGDTWRGATIYRSDDGGQTFTAIAGTSTKPTTGRVDVPLPIGAPHSWDWTSTLTVTVQTGELESRPAADVLAGSNMLAVGAHGRWELVAFREVTQVDVDTFELRGLLRGRRGTEHLMGTGQAGDTFVLVSGNGIIRLPMAPELLEQDRIYKAVTHGMAYMTGTDATLRTEGVAMLPFSPVHLEVTVETNGDWTITWMRRDRLGRVLRGPLPMSEATERYRVTIETAGSPAVPIRVLEATSETVTYTAAQQASDLLEASSAICIRVEQMSELVGAGTPAIYCPPGLEANEGGLGEVPFTRGYDDAPSLLGVSDYGVTPGAFIFALKGRKGDIPAVGFYLWPGAVAAPTDAFADTYDAQSSGSQGYVPSSYFDGMAAPNNQQDGNGTPRRGFNPALPEWAVYWRVDPGSLGRKFLFHGSDDGPVGSTSRAALPLSLSGKNVIGLMPMAAGGFRALVATDGVTSTDPLDVYSSADGQAWTLVGAVTGDMPTFESLSNITLVEHSDRVVAYTAFGNYQNTAKDLVDWDNLGATTTPLLDALRGSDPIAQITDIAYSGDTVIAVGFSAEGGSSGLGGYVYTGQKNRIARSTDKGATWTLVRDVAQLTDTPAALPGLDLLWHKAVAFGTGFIVYGRNPYTGAFPFALVSTDAGATFGAPTAVNTGDITGNATIGSALSNGVTILAVDSNTRRWFNGSREYDPTATPVAYPRLSYSTDGINFAGLMPGFPEP